MLVVCAIGFLLWFVFGVAMTSMMVYGVFDNVAMGPAVMAAVLATGTAFIGFVTALAAAAAARRARRDRFR
ncbi:ABC-type antimicrobial peptide transport system permease subunit [Amorphus suaedae]